ncbi:MAG: acetolactate synthase small subunit [Immundisolibacteraceae bacterium]|nr:acetolactate synthase small subunit [Immundisolibacteraceae bacterium]
MRRIISLLLENEPGALSRVAGLFSARGFNIESLTVAPSDDPTVSRMTVVTIGDADIVEQIVKQLNKLIDVIKLMDITDGDHLDRELMLVKVRATSAAARDEIDRVVRAFNAHIVEITRQGVVIEVTGDNDKLKGFLDVVESGSLIEVVRSGPCAISRGGKALKI